MQNSGSAFVMFLHSCEDSWTSTAQFALVSETKGKEMVVCFIIRQTAQTEIRLQISCEFYSCSLLLGPLGSHISCIIIKYLQRST